MQKRTIIIIISVLLVLFIAALGAGGYYFFYYLNGPCGINRVEAAHAELRAIVPKWDDASALASSTPRYGLPAMIRDLQEIKRDTEAIDVPVCLNQAKTHLVSSMTSTIEGYTLFLSQGPEEAINTKFESAAQRLDWFADELVRINICKPNCAEK